MANKKHLTLNERLIIETMLNQKASFRDIADAITKNPTSISREIRSHLIFRRIGGMHLNYNACVHRFNCSKNHICITNKDSITISERTLYRLIDARIISAMNIDLPRKVRYSARKKSVSLKVDKACRIGRDYDCFMSFLQNNPDSPVVQLDSVEGSRGGKVLLTIHFVKAEMMLAFLREHNTSQSVIDIFNTLYEKLGNERFSRIFKVCLTDTGSEFSNPKAIEYDDSQNLRTRVFYCNPSAPYQKGSAERNHEFIRCFIPKGTSLDSYSQADISLMMNHINSYCRESLGNKSPYEMFAFLYGDALWDLLECHQIPPQEVTLNKSIFHKEANDESR